MRSVNGRIFTVGLREVDSCPLGWLGETPRPERQPIPNASPATSSKVISSSLRFIEATTSTATPKASDRPYFRSFGTRWLSKSGVYTQNHSVMSVLAILRQQQHGRLWDSPRPTTMGWTRFALVAVEGRFSEMSSWQRQTSQSTKPHPKVLRESSTLRDNHLSCMPAHSICDPRR